MPVTLRKIYTTNLNIVSDSEFKFLAGTDSEGMFTLNQSSISHLIMVVLVLVKIQAHFKLPTITAQKIATPSGWFYYSRRSMPVTVYI